MTDTQTTIPTEVSGGGGMEIPRHLHLADDDDDAYRTQQEHDRVTTGEMDMLMRMAEDAVSQSSVGMHYGERDTPNSYRRQDIVAKSVGIKAVSQSMIDDSFNAIVKQFGWHSLN